MHDGKRQTVSMASKGLNFKGFSGGADRDRTDDLLNAIQALSQLSYSPKCKTFISIIKLRRLSMRPLSRNPSDFKIASD
jgi:hypothetical protein